MSSYSHLVHSPVPLTHRFFNLQHMYNPVQGGPDSIVRGLASTLHEKFDRFIVSGLTKNLFAAPAGSLGLDLAALNIQRGRDHGLPGYNAWRVLCGLPRACSFDGLATEIPDASTKAKLADLYSHVDDIDLFAAGLAERSVPGGLLGPTFTCLIGRQFRELRKGDRFWFENQGQFSQPG
ncbi:lactoperoxidase-like [Branchiostoma floridae x Branchiostoma japonicum]